MEPYALKPELQGLREEMRRRHAPHPQEKRKTGKTVFIEYSPVTNPLDLEARYAAIKTTYRGVHQSADVID